MGHLLMAKRPQTCVATRPKEGDDTERAPAMDTVQIVRNWLYSMTCAFKEPKRLYETTELQKKREQQYFIDLAKTCAQEKEKRTRQILSTDKTYLHVNHEWRCLALPSLIGFHYPYRPRMSFVPRGW